MFFFSIKVLHTNENQEKKEKISDGCSDKVSSQVCNESLNFESENCQIIRNLETSESFDSHLSKPQSDVSSTKNLIDDIEYEASNSQFNFEITADRDEWQNSLSQQLSLGSSESITSSQSMTPSTKLKISQSTYQSFFNENNKSNDFNILDSNTNLCPGLRSTSISTTLENFSDYKIDDLNEGFVSESDEILRQYIQSSNLEETNSKKVKSSIELDDNIEEYYVDENSGTYQTSGSSLLDSSSHNDCYVIPATENNVMPPHLNSSLVLNSDLNDIEDNSSSFLINDSLSSISSMTINLSDLK